MLTIAGMDIGNENVQVMLQNIKSMFKNKIDEGKSIDTNLTVGKNTYNVEYEGIKYVIGDYAEQPSNRMEGKNSKKHLLAGLTSLSTSVESGSDVKLVIGESLNAYFNKEHKKALRSRFIGSHEIIVNGRAYKYNIKDVHILPESIGHKLLNYHKYVNNKVSYTLDMGSSTINYGYYEGLIPIESKCAAYTLGMHNLISNISKSFSRNGGPYNCTQQQIKEYIEYGCKNPKLQEIVEIEINKQFDKLESLLQADGVNIHHLDEIEFCGGVTITLKKYIEARYKNAVIVENSLWSNCEGFLKFALQKFS